MSLWDYMEGEASDTITAQLLNTVKSLLEAPSLIEAPPRESAHCHGIVAPPQNRSAGRL